MKMSAQMHKQLMTEEHIAKIGNCIAEVLMLKQIKRGEQKDRYDTQYGTKTPLGIYRVVKKIIDEERINV